MEFPARKQKIIDKLLLIITIAFCLFIFSERTTLADCMEIDDEPVEAQIQGAPANIMFIIDDADSMDNEISTLESDTEFAGFEYLYGIAGDYVASCGNDDCSDSTKELNVADYLGEGGGNERGSWKALWYDYNKVYYNPTITYTPWPSDAGGHMAEANPDLPYSHPIDQGFQMNLDKVYFSVAYQLSDGTAASSALSIPISHYYIKDSGNIYLVIIRGPHGSCTYEYYQIIGASATTSGYPEWQEGTTYAAKTMVEADGAVYATKKGGTSVGDSLSNDTGIKDWLLVSDPPAPVPQTIADDGVTVRKLASANVPAAIKFWTDPDDERQNFANWFQYYRRRQLMAVNAIAKTIFNLSGVNMGFTATEPATDTSFSDRSTNPADYLNLGLRDSSGHGLFIQPVLPVDTYKTELLNRLYDYRAGTTSSSNFVRRALEEVGKYFDNADDLDTNFGPSPITETCQQNFVVVFCDGAYSGGAPNNGTGWDDLTSSSDSAIHVSIIDDKGTTDTSDDGTIILTGESPYSDGATKTMADMSMWFYIKDLATNLDDEVPTNDVDLADWQHLVTYTITFGDKGLHDPNAVPTTTGGTAPFDLDDSTTWPAAAYSISCTPWCWPGNVTSGTDPEKIDDIWHSAVNGRGEFFAADNPQKLEKALSELIDSIKDRIGASGSAVSVSSDQLDTGTYIYQTQYNTKGWSGEIIAYDYCLFTGSCPEGYESKKASEQIEKQFGSDTDNDDILDTWDFSSRTIYTYNSGSVITFSGDQSSTLDTTLTEDVVNYIRGEKINEEQFNGSMRDRITNNDKIFTLSDIVHSSPTFYNNVLYVGANDGMMHALRAKESADGAGDQLQEIFAYIPSFVHGHLAELSDPGYNHKYYVDQTPYAVDTTPGDDTTGDILVGGLGKGGKGYFGIDISGIDNTTTSVTLTNAKVWEYPSDSGVDGDGDNLDDMGYSFSRVWVVKSHLNETYDGKGNSNKDGDWVVIFGNGYNSEDGDAILFILDTSGTLVKAINTGEDTCNGLSSPAPVDTNNDGIMDYIYAGDLKGNLWKFDVTSSDAKTNDEFDGWRVYYNNAYTSTSVTDPDGNTRNLPKPSGTPQPLFESGKPITTMPDVIRHCAYNGSIVVFGTGKLLSVDDIPTSGHRVYGIWDFGYKEKDPTEYLGELDSINDVLSNPSNGVTLKHLTVEQSDSYRVIGRNDGSPNWSPVDDQISPFVQISADQFNGVTDSDSSFPDLDAYKNPYLSGGKSHAGWYFNLDTNERVVINPRIRSGFAYIVTATPNPIGECSSFSGSSWVMAVDACTGTVPDEAVWDTDSSGTIDENDIVSINDSDTYATGIKKTMVVGMTLVSDQVILSLDEDSSNTSNTTGTLVPSNLSFIGTNIFGSGFLYWWQVE